MPTQKPLITKGTLVLLGDSIIDNNAYVAPNQNVTAKLTSELGNDWQISKLAIDGATVREIVQQCGSIPKHTSYIVLSGGGNDALRATQELYQVASSVQEALAVLTTLKENFHIQYSRLLDIIDTVNCPVAIMTIYDNIPLLPENLRTTLSLYNDVITRETLARGHHLIDLRILCNEASDYSGISEIEPSERGGDKIVQSINKFLTHNSVQP
ncbi:MAG: SGNH/GDSL hydrolase family protein [Natronospirillum sp.]